MLTSHSRCPVDWFILSIDQSNIQQTRLSGLLRQLLRREGQAPVELYQRLLTLFSFRLDGTDGYHKSVDVLQLMNVVIEHVLGVLDEQGIATLKATLFAENDCMRDLFCSIPLPAGTLTGIVLLFIHLENRFL